jgi:C1A family cysteine protease
MKVADRVFSTLVSPFDIRDFKVAVTTKEFPETFVLPEVSVKNQGSVGSCVAHACSSVVEYHNKKQQGTTTIFSTEFIYGYRPAGYYVGEGMYIRDALKTLTKVGDCPLTNLRGNHEYKEAMANVAEQLDTLADKAYPHRISSYAKVKTAEEIKTALLNYGYVVASMNWYKDYRLKNGIYTYNSTEKSGRHCVVIYGWNEDGWLVHNSWGHSWGKKGKFIVPFDFKWNEAWAIIDTIVNEGEVIKPEEQWYIKLFGKILNKIANFFRKLFKKI